MAERTSDGRVTAVFSAVHFLVDLACIFLLTAFIVLMVEDRTVWMLCVLTYNFCAFACQLPIGALGDRMKNPFLMAAIGCVLIAIAYGMVYWGNSFLPETALLKGLPLLVSVTAGIGNSCFHVGGGIEVLRRSGPKAALPGVFVSTGAFGVFLGPVLAGKKAARDFGVPAGILIMAVCAAVLLAYRKSAVRLQASKKEPAHAAAEHLPRKPEWRDMAGPAALCLILTVLLRSYAGTVMGFGWKRGMTALFFTAGIVFGKMAGGFLGDRIGWMRAAMLSLGGSAVLFALAESRPVFGIAAVFLFNMTMPLTLSALAGLYRDSAGTAFGMLTLALFLGTLPSMMTAAGWIPGVTFRILPTVSLLSAGLMAAGLALFFGKRGETA